MICDTDFRTIADVLRLGAEQYADCPAYWTSQQKNSPVTYSQVYDSACRTAGFLRAGGINAGDSVCIYAPNIHEWPLVFWGIILSGAVVVPMDPNSGSAEIAHIFRDTGAEWVFTTDKLAPKLDGIPLKSIVIIDKKPTSKGMHSLESIQATGMPERCVRPVDPEAAVVVIYTSGTISQPKGVVLTHKNIISNLSSVLRTVPLDSHDLFLSIISLSHTFELTRGLVMPFMAGASVVYVEDMKYTTIFKCMQEFHPTMLLCVPTMLKMILENAVHKVTGERTMSLSEIERSSTVREILAKDIRDILGGNVRYFVSGGAPLAVSVSLGYRDIGVKLLQSYGLTETSGVSTLTPPGDFPIGSAGQALDNVEIRIDSPDETGIGEICIRGDHLMAGYNNNPSATEETIRGGWLYSGDLGYLDNDGFLFITGRSKNVIVTAAGVNVYPEELEERIMRSPFVSEICVIGKQKPDRTETVFAAVVVNEEYLAEFMGREVTQRQPLLADIVWQEIHKYTADLASIKHIQDFQIRSHPLPRGRTQKIIRDMVNRESFSILGRMGLYAQCKENEVPIVFTNATAITPFRTAHKSHIVIESDKITQFGTFDTVYLPPNARVIDMKDKYVVPGFIDLHVHGGGGHDFNNTEESEVETILDYFISHGTTLLLATMYVEQKQKYLKAIGNIAELCKKSTGHGVLHGIHLEGPFINRDMRGALNEDYIWDATIDNQLLLERAGQGVIKVMTIAPEINGAGDVMQIAAQAGICLAIAHSKASYEYIDAAIDLGLSQVTDIFNAMSSMDHRTPGILTAAFLRRELKVHLMADSRHVHPAIVTLLYKLKGASGIILISDAISASGCSDGIYNLSGQAITVRHGRAYLADGALAGSTVTLDQSVKFIVENTDIPIQEAVRMATLNPARVLGLDHKKGSIAVGRDADLVVLDKNYEVEMVLIAGKPVYQKQG